MALNGILGWPLIHRYGPVGAAIANLVSLTAFGLMEGVVVSRRLFTPDVFGPLARAAVAAAGMAGVLTALSGLPLLLLPPIGAVVYFGILIGIGTFSRSEMQIARDLTSGWLNAALLSARRGVASGHRTRAWIAPTIPTTSLSTHEAANQPTVADGS